LVFQVRPGEFVRDVSVYLLASVFIVVTATGKEVSSRQAKEV